MDSRNERIVEIGMSRKARESALAVILVGLLLWPPVLGAQESSGDTAPPCYYYSAGRICTMMMDFQSIRHRLDSLDQEKRQAEIALIMAQEFSRGGASKCPQAEKVRLEAVYVPTKDNYGRPDFRQRIQIMRIDGPVDVVRRFAASGDPEKFLAFKNELAVTFYGK